MEKAVDVVNKKNALAQIAGQLSVTPQELTKVLKETAFRECKSDSEFLAAVVVAATYRLNPLTKEIYAFPGSRGGVVPVVSIDGWIKIVSRNPQYDGVELTENLTPDGSLNKSGTAVDSVTAKFHLKDSTHPVTVTEYMAECYDETKQPWKRWPRRMLRHKAYIQGARVAFGISGIYDEDEAQRIIEAEKVVDAPMIKAPQEISAPAAGPAPGETADPKKEVAALTVGVAIFVEDKQTIPAVAGMLINIKERTVKTSKNPKSVITDYTIAGDSEGDQSTMKISIWGSKRDSIDIGIPVVVHEVLVTVYQGSMQYLGKSIVANIPVAHEPTPGENDAVQQ